MTSLAARSASNHSNLTLTDVRLEHGGARIHLSLERGLAAWVLTSKPGLTRLHRALAGLERPRGGRVAWGGRDPYSNPTLRARLGTLFPEEPSFSGPLHVGEFIARARRARLLFSELPERSATALERQSPPLHAALPFPEAWRERRMDNLDAKERRRLALSFALETPNPLGLVLHEPFAAIAPAEEPALLEALSTHAAADHPVLVTTTSSQEAARLSASPLRFIPQRETSSALLLRVESPESVYDALRADPDVPFTRQPLADSREILIFGASKETLARAAARAAREKRVTVLEMGFVPAPEIPRGPTRGQT